MFADPILERLNVQTIWVLHRPVPLNHRGDPRAILFAKEFCSMIAHIAKPLNNDRLGPEIAR